MFVDRLRFGFNCVRWSCRLNVRPCLSMRVVGFGTVIAVVVVVFVVVVVATGCGGGDGVGGEESIRDGLVCVMCDKVCGQC